MNKMLVTYVTCASSMGEVDMNVAQVRRAAGTTVDVRMMVSINRDDFENRGIVTGFCAGLREWYPPDPT